MSKIKEMLRLKYRNQLSNRQIQTMTGVSRNSVANYIKSYIALDSELEDILELADGELQELFHPTKQSQPKKPTLNHPDWNEIHEELSKKGMTRRLLWEELKEKQPELYSYSQFNRYYAKNGANRTPKPVEFGHPCRFYSDSDAGEHSDTLE